MVSNFPSREIVSPAHPDSLSVWRVPLLGGLAGVALVMAMLPLVPNVIPSIRDSLWRAAATGQLVVSVLLVVFCWMMIRRFRRTLESERKHANRLRTMLHTDSTTGLRTASAQRELINKWIDSRTPFSLMVLSLDDFRLINSNIGPVGSKVVLAQVAKIMRTAVGSNGELARASGSEFTLLVAHTLEHAPLLALARRIQSSLERPLPFQGAIVYVALSVGIARYPHDASSVDEILRKANVALQDANA